MLDVSFVPIFHPNKFFSSFNVKSGYGKNEWYLEVPVPGGWRNVPGDKMVDGYEGVEGLPVLPIPEVTLNINQ